MVLIKDEEWNDRVRTLTSYLKKISPIRSTSVVDQLMTLANGDQGLVIQAVTNEHGFDQAKEHIINERISKLEEDLYYDDDDTELGSMEDQSQQ